MKTKYIEMTFDLLKIEQHIQINKYWPNNNIKHTREKKYEQNIKIIHNAQHSGDNDILIIYHFV